VAKMKAATSHLSRSTTENHDKTITAELEVGRGFEPRIAGKQVKNTIRGNLSY
jgi:hypothetical protein